MGRECAFDTVTNTNGELRWFAGIIDQSNNQLFDPENHLFLEKSNLLTFYFCGVCVSWGDSKFSRIEITESEIVSSFSAY